MKKTYLVLMLYLVFWVVGTANALIKEDLYSADIKVSSRELDEAQRKKLTEQALSEVLQKITGKVNTLDIKNVEKYLSKYSYNNDVVGDQIILKISFDQKIVSQALIDSNYKFLGEYRPLTIIWSKSPEINHNQELLQQILSLAKLNGLSVMYPMFDMIDLEALQQITDDEQQLIMLIKQASKRYSVDEIIFVEYKPEENGSHFWRSFTSDWQLKTEGVDFAAQANLLIDKMMESFIKRYAAGSCTAKEKEVVVIKITNVINLEDYVRVENYLQNLSFIKSLQATKFQAGEVEFELVANGGKEFIKNAIASSGILQESYSKNSVDHNVLLYTLQM
ncbi:MAG: DUF2066 domain-containing protein [Gammaproteobacteria bacterium]|jgi:hypothetical protein